MQNLKIPGVAWAALIVILIALIHENQASLPIDKFYVDLFIVGLVAVVKSINLGTAQLNQALNVIDEILGRAQANRTRGVAVGDSQPEPIYGLDELASKAPPRPNALTTWLIG